MQNLHLTFHWHYIGQNYGEDFVKFCGLLRLYEPGPHQNSCYGIYDNYFDLFQYKWQIGCIDILVFSSQPTELP